MKTLQEESKETQQKIFDAWVSGEKIQINRGGEWVGSSTLTLYDHTRIKPKEPQRVWINRHDGIFGSAAYGHKYKAEQSAGTLNNIESVEFVEVIK